MCSHRPVSMLYIRQTFKSENMPAFQVGGATAQIGDPSGRKSERPQLSVSEVQANSQKLLENLNKIFSNHKQYFWEKEDDLSLPAMRYVI